MPPGEASSPQPSVNPFQTSMLSNGLTLERREAEVLAELARTINTSLDLGKVLQKATEGAKELCGGDAAAIALREPQSETMVIRHTVGIRYQGSNPVRIRAGKGAGGHVILTGRPFRTDNYAEDCRISKDYIKVMREEGIVAAMIVPIRIQDRVEGLLGVTNRSSRPFTDGDETILVRLADHAAIAIQNARLFEQSERRRKAAESLAEVGRLITQSLNLDEVGKRIVDSTLWLLGAQTSALFRLEPESGDLVVLAASGDVGPAFGQNLVLPKGTGVAGLAVKERRPVVTPDILTDPRIMLTPELRAVIEQMPCRTVLDVPLLVKDTVIGALGVGAPPGRLFDEEEIRLLQTFAAEAAIALENARLYGELRGALQEIEASQQRMVQTERLRALGEMAGGVTHDFNNTLAIILGRVQLLLAETRDPTLQQQLRVIEQAAMDGARTVRRTQEFIRRRPARPFEAVDLHQLVEEVVEVTRPRWKDEAQVKGIRYDIRVERVPQPMVAGDPSELREALANLVFNALEAMPKGRQLTFKTGTKGERVYCVVADTGIGMPEEVRRRVFEPFFTTKAEKGSGLGLSVAYGILTRHGGEIEVQSQVGHGSAFTIWLPLGREIAAAPKKARPSLASPRARVLVIEDEPEIRKLLADLLAGQGHTVAVCPDGASGLTRFQEERFDLVITDLGMPGLSGWEVARSVSARSPETPVVLVTGWGDQIDPEEASAKGVKFLVTKPFRLEDIRAVVNQAVSRQPTSVPTPKATRRWTPRAHRKPAS